MKINNLISIFAVLMLFVSTASAQNNINLTSDGEGGYYVCMPVTGTSNLTLSNANVSSFKLYDDGGLNGNYSANCRGYLTITAPIGYRLELIGTMSTYYSMADYIYVYDSANENATIIGDRIQSISTVPFNIGTITSSNRSLTIFFRTSPNSHSQLSKGFDFTVLLIANNIPRAITINQVTNGSVVSNVQSANVGDIVTLTATPNKNYRLESIIVTDSHNNEIAVTGGWYTNNVVKFSMPGTAVNVKPTFSSNEMSVDGGLYINMPKIGSLTATIPSNVSSFKLYDDGGVSGKYSYNCDGTLTITAPAGFVLSLSGTATIDDYDSDFLCIYDGANSDATLLTKVAKSVNKSINKINSTGNSITLYFKSDNGYNYPGFDFTVTLIAPTEAHNVIIPNGITHGTIVSNKSSAKFNESITLTVTPDEGYVLRNISVSDASSILSLTPSTTNASFGDVNYYTSDKFTFAMCGTDATVSATFMPKTDFYVNIPNTGQRSFTVPDGTTSFKVYDENYYVNGNGNLLLTAPQGFKMKVSGKAYIFRWSSMCDYLEIFDGATNAATSLGKFWESTNQSDPNYTPQDNPGLNVNVTSTGNNLLLYFYSDNGGYTEEGLNLTVTLIDNHKSVKDLAVTIPDQTYTGSKIEPKITIKDGNATLTEGTDYTVEYSNNTNAGTSAKVTITGKGNYTGTVEKTFTINPRVTTLGALTLTEYGNRTTAEIQGDFTNISSEGKSLVISEPKTVDKVIFKRSFTKGIPATIMLPFGFTPDGDNIGSFYTLKSVECKNGEWIATMSDPVIYVEANKPYIFKSAVEELNEMSFEDENKDDDEVGITLQPTSDIKENPNGDWTLHGVYEKTMLYGNGQINYGFAGKVVKDDGIGVGDFIRAGQGVWADPMRCYLTYKDGELTTKAATVLPDRIRVVFPDEVDEDPFDTEIITPVTETVKESVVKVWSYNKTVIIESQPDTDYTIVDLSGRILKTGVTHSTHEEVTLGNNTGIVIVNINGKAFKVNL